MNSGAPEGLVVPAPLVTPVVLISIVFMTFGLLAHTDFKIMWPSNTLILSQLDESISETHRGQY